MSSFRLSSKQFWETFIFTPIFLFQSLFEGKIYFHSFFQVLFFNKRRIKLRQRHKIYFCVFDAILFILPYINVIFITVELPVFLNCHVYSSLPVRFIIVGAFTVFWSNNLYTFIISAKSQYVTIQVICDMLRSWQTFQILHPFLLILMYQGLPCLPSFVYHIYV
jgi:hypothetical protein